MSAASEKIDAAREGFEGPTEEELAQFKRAMKAMAKQGRKGKRQGRKEKRRNRWENQRRQWQEKEGGNDYDYDELLP